MDKIANMQAFATVARTGSFAEAARQLNVANSVVSKRISDLEGYLGAQLLTRTTRRVSLTDTGYGYLEYVRKFLDDMAEVENSIRHRAQTPVGTLRITAPISFGMQYLGPALASYLKKYPDVTIRTSLSDRHVDMAAEGFDLALRIGSLQDSSLIARKLGACRRVICATPTYLKKHGRPDTPADLAGHNCLSYTNIAEGRSWPYCHGGKKLWQPVSGNFMSDSGELLYQAALAGNGITLLPTFIVGKAVADGRLQTVLQEYEETDFDVYAVYQNSRHLSPKVRTMVDHMASAFRRGFIA